MTHHYETLPLRVSSRKWTLSPPVVTGLRIIVETSAILIAAMAAGVIWHRMAYAVSGDQMPLLEFGTAFAIIFALVSFFRDDFRRSAHLSAGKSAQRLFEAFTIAFVTAIVAGFLTKTSDVHSRGSVVLFYGVGLATLVTVRLTATQVIGHVTRAGWVSAGRVMAIGFSADLDQMIERGAPHKHGFDLVAVEPVPHPFEATATQTADVIDRLVEKARWLQPDTIVLALPWSHSGLIDRFVRAFMNLPVRVELAPEQVLVRFADLRIARLGALLTLNVLRPPMGHTGRAMKRLFDITFASLGLLLLMPLFVLAAIAIRLDSPGPVLFRQTRYGFNQRPFRIWKFRTMRVMDDGPVVKQATRDDDRITRIGRTLRKWNIDELPQLLNVIAGDMSLVGPRPHAVAHNQLYEGKIALYARRHNVLPGITGWAQVNGFRGATDDGAMQKRIDYDLYYLDNWSMGFDVMIIFMTVFSSRSYRNAY